MIDRIKLRFDHLLVRPAYLEGALPCAWRRSFRHRSDYNGVPTDYVVFELENRLIRIETQNGLVKLVEGNPCRLLHGGHGCVLKSQAELNSAFQKFFGHVAEICALHQTLNGLRVILIELGWNYPTPFEHIEPLITLARHPWVDKAPSVQANVCWKHEGSMFNMKLYNKAKVMVLSGEALAYVGGKPLTCTRLEFTIRGKKLRDLWAKHRLAPIPSFTELQMLTRFCLEQLNAPVVLNGDKDLDRHAILIAALIKEEKKVNGLHPLDFSIRGMSPRRVARLRKRVDAVVLKSGAWSVRALLGDGDDWPPPCEIRN